MTRWYQLVMDSTKNPLSNIPDTNTRHMIMQVLAWMWCIVFALMDRLSCSASVRLSTNLVSWYLYHAGRVRDPAAAVFGGLGRGNGHHD